MNSSHQVTLKVRLMRNCLRNPIPEINFVARLLDVAVERHLRGDRLEVCRLLNQSNMPEVRDWTESLWGKRSLYAPKGPFWSLPVAATGAARTPNRVLQHAL